MSSVSWLADPTGESTGTQLNLSDGTTYILRSQDAPPPEPAGQYVSSVDADGDTLYSARYANRTITLGLACKGANATAISAAVKALQDKCAKMTRDAVLAANGVGGTLQYTTPAGATVVFDVCSATCAPQLGAWEYGASRVAPVTLTFNCLPFGRGTPVTGSVHSETSLPVLVWTETSVSGDVPALGKLVITEGQAVDQASVMWGVQSKTYSSSANAALFYEAESRTPKDAGAATAAGPSGSSGSGNNTILANALTSLWQDVMSTQASGGGADLSHVGRYRFYARVQGASANVGTVNVRLSWTQGDLRNATVNDSVALPANGQYVDCDLGIVNLTAVRSGTQRWRATIQAKSNNTGDDIYIDCFWLRPADEGSGIASIVPSYSTQTTLKAQDGFNQSSGALSGKSLDLGGTWSTAGGTTTDFQESGASSATRNKAGDTGSSNNGRLAVASGSASMTGTQVSVRAFSLNHVTGAYGGLIARYTDTNNFLQFYGDMGANYGDSAAFFLGYWLSGAWVPLAQYTSPFGVFPQPVTFSLTAYANGTVQATASIPVGQLVTLSGSSSVLATGGTLASGKAGIFDFQSSSTANTRYFSQFSAYAINNDAALYASQTLTIGDSYVDRMDSTGTTPSSPASYVGDYLRVPVAGREGRTTRFMVKASRAVPGSLSDSGIDDISAQLTYTPLFLALPA